MLHLSNGKAVPLSAKIILPKIKSGQENAWVNQEYTTITLLQNLNVLRMHFFDGKIIAGITDKEKKPSGLIGSWFFLDDNNIEDIIISKNELYDKFSTPKMKTIYGETSLYSDLSCFMMSPNTILNIGIASALFGWKGGGIQLEFIHGTEPSYKGEKYGSRYFLNLSNKYGNA